MKLHVLSDLHMRPEHGLSLPHTKADIIILAGDISRGLQGVQWAIQESERLNKPVLYVFGNHEFYQHTFPNLIDQARQLCQHTQVHVLENNTFIYGNTRFLGCTLWTDFMLQGSTNQAAAIEQTEQFVYDYQIVEHASGRTLCVKDTIALHHASRRWLETELAKPWPGHTVVITHHAPSKVAAHPHFDNLLSTSFASHLDALISQHDIATWVCGHSHANVDTYLGHTHLYSNQKGYRGEQVPGPAFSLDKTISVGGRPRPLRLH